MRQQIGIIALGFTLGRCAAPHVPDPHDAVNAYAIATSSGDVSALYEVLSAPARQRLTLGDIQRALKEEHAELLDRTQGWLAKDALFEATARVRLANGEDAALLWDGNRFKVASAGALPGGARTPEEALTQLRRALVHRNYAAVLRLVSPTARRTLEETLRSLIDNLEKIETLPIKPTGESSATTDFPGGHQMHLEREGGIWRIERLDW